MIARTWRGWTRARDVEPYVAYLGETGVKELRGTPGNCGVFVFTRIDGDRAEFQVISLWESMDAVRAFAGDDERVAVFYPDDDRFLVDRERHADHYDVAVEEPGRT
jgi:heme-degrading monooxygenase HmoA